MKKLTKNQIWKQYGLMPKGIIVANRWFPLAQRLVEMCAWADDPKMAIEMVVEAVFQKVELPRRSKAFRAAYPWGE